MIRDVVDDRTGIEPAVLKYGTDLATDSQDVETGQILPVVEDSARLGPFESEEQAQKEREPVSPEDSPRAEQEAEDRVSLAAAPEEPPPAVADSQSADDPYATAPESPRAADRSGSAESEW